jgi:hypothetical protein
MHSESAWTNSTFGLYITTTFPIRSIATPRSSAGPAEISEPAEAVLFYREQDLSIWDQVERAINRLQEAWKGSGQDKLFLRRTAGLERGSAPRG